MQLNFKTNADRDQALTFGVKTEYCLFRVTKLIKNSSSVLTAKDSIIILGSVQTRPSVINVRVIIVIRIMYAKQA